MPILLVFVLALPIPIARSHVVLAFHDAPIPAGIVTAAVAEAATIWSPYGVTIAAASTSMPVPLDATVLTVACVRMKTGQTLGAIAFIDGSPGRVLTVFVDAIVRLVATARLMGATEAQWPVCIRDQVLARAIGRVIAHEIGHYVLGTRGHAATGLMRAQHTADELVAPDSRYVLVTPW
jgi:hypothetical protein